MDFSLSVEQVATLSVWRQRAFVISVKHQPATNISFPLICCPGIIPWLLHGLTCVWAPGAAHTQGTQAHPSGIDGLAPGLDIIMSCCQERHNYFFHQETFPSWLLIKSSGKEGRLSHQSEVGKGHFSCVVASAVQWEAKNCLSLIMAHTSVAFGAWGFFILSALQTQNNNHFPSWGIVTWIGETGK